MKIIKSTVLKLDITKKDCDTIQVYLEDFFPGHGQITITCYGDSWTHFWPGMGNRKIHEFFYDCDCSYLIGKLLDYKKHSEFDYTATIRKIKEDILQARRDGEIKKQIAFDLYGEINDGDDGDGDENAVCNVLSGEGGIGEIIYGGDWYDCIKYKKSGDYNYMKNFIIPTVKEAFLATFEEIRLNKLRKICQVDSRL